MARIDAFLKLGTDQGFFWLLAIATFYLPLAAVVIYLNKRMPLEGGIYQWAKLAFNDFVAFMVAWNLWIFGILVMSGIGLIIKKTIAYAIGPRADWMHENNWVTCLVCIVLMISVVAASRRGSAALPSPADGRPLAAAAPRAPSARRAELGSRTPLLVRPGAAR